MKKENWIALILIILPLIILTIPTFVQYAHNREVGVFYFYGLNETNYNCGDECFNNRNNYLPNLDESALYVPRVKEAGEGKYPSDPYIKEYSDKVILLTDIVPVFFYGLFARIISVDWVYLLNIFVLGALICWLFIFIINKYVKDKIISTIIVVAAFFFPYHLFKLFKASSIGLGLFKIIPDYFVPDIMFTRFIHMSFALALFFLSLILLQKIIEGELDWKKKLGILILFLLNAYTYFYSWVMFGGIVAFLGLIYLLSKNYQKFKRMLFVAVIYVIGSLPILIKGLLLKTDPAANIYGLKSFTGGDFINFLYLTVLLLILLGLVFYALPEKKRKQLLKNNFTHIIFAGLVVSLVFVNTEILKFIPQPWHFAIFFKYFFVASLLTLIFLLIKNSNWQQQTQKKTIKILFIIIYLIVILITTAYTVYVEKNQTFASQTMLDADKEMLIFFNENAKDSTILTVSQYANNLIPIYTNSYVYVPDKLYSLASVDESVSRYITACKYFEMQDVCISMFYDVNLTNYWYKGKVTHQMDFDKAEAVLIRHLNDLHLYDYDFVLITPLEAKFVDIKKIEMDNTLVFNNSVYRIYERK